MKSKITEEARLLHKELNDLGIQNILEHFDGFKCIDIYIPKGKIYIEIDGLQHYTSRFQIMADFQRDHYSDDAGFHTFHIPNQAVREHCPQIAHALEKMLEF